MLFESFMVFYLLEILVLVSVAIWYYKEPNKKFVNNMPPTAKRPLASDLIKIRRLHEQLRRARGEI